jgi:hypothetical protein
VSMNEGVLASYVGRRDGSVQTGDRCAILSDQGSTLFVRWITGSATDQYAHVRPIDIVADLRTTATDDEFGFEVGGPPQKVGINVSAVFERGGEVALFEALESKGHLDRLRESAREAVLRIKASLATDEEWMIVRSALGEDADDVESSAIIAAIAAAAEE